MTISVVIASYNYGCYLPEAIESVLSQSRIPDELLVVNDGSTDDTLMIAKKYEHDYPGLIRAIDQKENLGIVETFSRAVASSSGEYICFLGADNVFERDYLLECECILSQDPACAIAYTDYKLFGSRAENVWLDHNPDWRAPKEEDGFWPICFPQYENEGIESLRRQNFIHGSAMYSRKAYDYAGGYRQPELGLPEDQGLFIRMLNDGKYTARKVTTGKGRFLLYRQHSEDQANIKVQKQAKEKAYDEVVAHWQRDVEELRKEIAIRDRMIADRDRTIDSLSGGLKGRIIRFAKLLLARSSN